MWIVQGILREVGFLPLPEVLLRFCPLCLGLSVFSCFAWSISHHYQKQSDVYCATNAAGSDFNDIHSYDQYPLFSLSPWADIGDEYHESRSRKSARSPRR